MSFWYNELSGQRPREGQIYTGERESWFPRFDMPNASAFDILVDAPARVIGAQLGPFIGVIFFGLSIAAGVYAGRWVSGRLGSVAGWIAGLLVGIYVALVLYRSQHWAAFSLLHSMTD